MPENELRSDVAMDRTLTAFADELIKTSSIAKLWKDLPAGTKSTLKSLGLWTGVDYALAPPGERSIAKAVRSAGGFVGGEALARNALKGSGRIKRTLGGMAGGIVGSHVAESLAKKASAPRSFPTPQSSNVAGFRYDAGTKQLFVTYKGGGTYKYNGVPPAVFRKLRKNKSVGKTINRSVKGGGYAYEKVAKQKNHKCKFCKEQATKGVIWAEGRGIVPCCDKHLGKGKASIGDPKDIDLIRDLTKTSSAQERFYTSSPKRKTPTQRYYERKRRLNKIAGAAKKQITWDGLKMKLEEVPGDTRTGTNREGKSWSRKMYDSYGYVPGTYGKGADGEAIDIWLAKTPVDGPVFEIRQNHRGGGYDESKFQIGFGTAAAAKKSYLRHMPSWAFGSMASMPMDKFKKIVGQG